MRTQTFLNALLEGFLVNFTLFLNFLSFACIPMKSWKAKASEDSNKNRVTRMQNDDVEWHRLNVHSKQGFVPDQSERPTLSEICPRVWIISWPAVYSYRESLHQAHNLIARLLSETSSIGTQRIGIYISPTNLQFPQHIHWRYCVDPLTSHNMRKKYSWVKPSRNTCNKNKPPKMTVNARQ